MPPVSSQIPEWIVAFAATMQAGFTIAVWRAASAQAKTAERMHELQKSIEDARSQIELIPALEMPTGVEVGMPYLSVANATPNGCRVLEAELVLARICTEREEQQRVSKYCPIKGTGVVPGFGEIQIDLREAILGARFAVWKGTESVTGTSCYPGLRLWAAVRYAARNQTLKAESQVYRAEWVFQMGLRPEPPQAIRGLKVDDSPTDRKG
jgi:hypothetical protein